MVIPPWFVSGVATLICIAVVIGAKHFWAKGLGLLIGLIFLQDFLLKFTHDTAALVITLLVAAIASAILIIRSRRKAKKKDEEKRNGGIVVNVGTTQPGNGRHRGP